jgi:hypothetical protein
VDLLDPADHRLVGEGVRPRLHGLVPDEGPGAGLERGEVAAAVAERPSPAQPGDAAQGQLRPDEPALDLRGRRVAHDHEPPADQVAPAAGQGRRVRRGEAHQVDVAERTGVAARLAADQRQRERLRPVEAPREVPPVLGRLAVPGHRRTRVRDPAGGQVAAGADRRGRPRPTWCRPGRHLPGVAARATPGDRGWCWYSTRGREAAVWVVRGQYPSGDVVEEFDDEQEAERATVGGSAELLRQGALMPLFVADTALRRASARRRVATTHRARAA